MVTMHRLFRLTQSAVAVVQDYFFDARYGLHTAEVIEVPGLDIGDQDKKHAVRYKPTRVRYFQELLSKCPLPRDAVFVDVGCGKGRVLLLAAKHGFRRCVGIELSPTLAETAKENAKKFSAHYPNSSPIEIHCSNILAYSFHPEENIYHLYWPFDRHITIQFLDKLRTSLRMSPRDCWLIINEFQFRDLLTNDPWFMHKQRIVYGASEFDVYCASKEKIQADPAGKA
jgi:SAM-dependent methyltransferase